MVIHDENLERVTNSPRLVRDLTLYELKTFDAGMSFPYFNSIFAIKCVWWFLVLCACIHSVFMDLWFFLLLLLFQHISSTQKNSTHCGGRAIGSARWPRCSHSCQCMCSLTPVHSHFSLLLCCICLCRIFTLAEHLCCMIFCLFCFALLIFISWSYFFLNICAVSVSLWLHRGAEVFFPHPQTWLVIFAVQC